MASFIFLIGVLILGCVCSSRLSSRFNMPCLLVFLGVGMLIRHLPDFGNFSMQKVIADVSGGLSWSVANFIGSLALAFILFSGGYDTSWKKLSKVKNRGALLATLGVLVTALLLGIFSYGALNLLLPFHVSFAFCLLLGSVISSTDAAAVFAILRGKSVGLKGDLQPMLEFESGSNDPMATFMTLFMLSIVEKEFSSGAAVSCLEYFWILPNFCVRMVVGLGIGILTARGMIWLLRRIRLEYDSLYYVLTIACVMLSYSLAEICYGNGFMAVYTAGVFLGNHDFVFHNSNGRFCDALAWLMQVFLFGMLGFMCRPGLIWEYKWCGVLLAFFLMFVARPAACFLCLAGSSYSRAFKSLISWVGLRGGAPIMLATYPMMSSMEVSVIQHGELMQFYPNEVLFNIVFFIVLLSVTVQGSTIMPVAKLLKLDAPFVKIPAPPLRFEHVFQAEGDEREYGDSKSGFDGARTGEVVISEYSDFHGKKLAEVGLSRDSFVLMIRRGEKYIVPHGNTVLRRFDHLTILGTPSVLEETAVLFRSHAETVRQ